MGVSVSFWIFVKSARLFICLPIIENPLELLRHESGPPAIPEKLEPSVGRYINCRRELLWDTCPDESILCKSNFFSTIQKKRGV